MSFVTGLQVANLSDVGMRRTTNQDSLAQVIADSPDLYRERGHLLLVADGMGAHAAGELASKLAADGIPHLYHKYRELSAPEAIMRAIRETNAEIHRRGTANPDFHNMGTTASALVLMPQGALAAHVGDSRIYRLRGQMLHQLTFDHSLQWELRASGQMPEGADLGAVIPKNVITRSLGPNSAVQIDLEGPHPIFPDDVYVICSDGLTGRVEDAELGAILASLPPQEAVRALVDLANLRGGPDNSTVIVAKVVGPEAASGATPAEPLRVGGAPVARSVHPAVWIVAGVCLLAALVMAAMLEWIPAAVALGGAAVAGLIGLVQRYGGLPSGTEVGNGRMLGRGPYTSVACPPSHELADKLAKTLDELREAARDGQWTINWQPLDECCRKALTADASGNYAEAIRQYCRGITSTMSELRKQPVKRTGDSAVED
ncbi:MAG: protein phosphatase 2C domain-containing protein [Planctomycetaceae bacterium]|nr:protein phosphatase 2C domain-containing protein [Planctomycetaceae bacterium]